GHRKGDLYYLDGVAGAARSDGCQREALVSRRVVVRETISPQIMHERLGHPGQRLGEEAMKLVDGLPIVDEKSRNFSARVVCWRNSSACDSSRHMSVIECCPNYFIPTSADPSSRS